MSEWKKVKLSEICSSISDGDHQPPPKSESGVDFITISNIDSTNHIDFSNAMHVPQEYYDSIDDKRKPHIGDVLYSVVGTFGIPVLIKREHQFVFQRHIAILRPDTSLVLPEFLYYSMLSQPFYEQADSIALGAAQRTISLTSLRNMTINLPNIEIQKFVTNHLLIYDKLIENNNQQISLLEEAAQRLYKEWFINLRFPGYENCKIIDGIPDGWNKRTIGSLFNVVRGKSYTSKELSDSEGIHLVNLSNIKPYGGYVRNNEKRFIGKYKPQEEVHENDLIMGITDMTQERRTVSRVALVPDINSKAIISMDLIKLVPKEGSTLFYYHMFKDGGYSDLISQFANGTNVLHLRPEVLKLVDCILPNLELQNLFSDAVKPIYSLINKLSDENNDFAESRDRLLPKLMSGEIEA